MGWYLQVASPSTSTSSSPMHKTINPTSSQLNTISTLTKTINKTTRKYYQNAITHLKPRRRLHPAVDPTIVFGGNFAPVAELPPTECHVVHGSIPAELDGVYIRNGPNPQFPPLGPLHFFEGDGMLHAVKISNGGGDVTFCSRYVETYKYVLERQAGGPIFPNVLSGFHGPADLGRFLAGAWRVAVGQIDPLKGFGLANTSLACFSGKLLALGESDLPYVVAPTKNGDVRTIGRWDFAGERLFANMTAHPKVDSDTGEAYAFRCSPFPPHLTFFRFDRTGVKHADVPIFSVNEPTLIHDFAVTSRFCIFPESQLVVDSAKLILSQGMPLVSDPNKVSRIGVMPRGATDDAGLTWHPVPGFNAMHIVNAWDDVVSGQIEIIASDAKPIGSVLTDLEATEFTLSKIKIDTKTGEITRNAISDRSLELGCVNPRHVGKKSRYAYLGTFEKAPRVTGVVKMDLEAGREVSRRFYGKSCFGGEPMFVPRDEDDTTSDEDDGFLVTYVHDEVAGESRFLVMDAKSPELEVLAAVRLPRRVPYGLHGIFLPERKLEGLYVD